MTDLIEAVIAEVSSGPSASRAVKLLQTALENGWTQNPYCSLVLRLTHPDGLPMFVRWDMGVTEKGKISWRFHGARASNGQPLTLNDAFLVAEHPEFVFPEPPDITEEVNDNDCPD